jgi:alpha-beta hydrolase superfamily lysophospholipase
MAPIERASGWTRSADGAALFWRSWRSSSPRAAVALVHGLGEHSGRYDHVGSFLAARGFDCWAGDCRGHGMSPGPRVHVDDFGRYADDAGAFLDLASKTARPLFLVGHSQGGLVALLRGLREPRGLSGVAVSSPYLAAHPSSAPSALRLLAASVLLRIAPSRLIASELDTGVLSHDPDVEVRYLADPLVSRKVSAAWFRAARAAQEEVNMGAPAFPLPCLVMASSDDRLVDPAAAREWARRAPPATTTFVEWPGLYHEMFNEVGKEKVLQRLVEWLDERVRTGT